MNDLKLFFRSPGDIAVKHAVNDTFVFSNTIISAWCAKHSSAAAVQKSTLGIVELCDYARA